MRVIADLGTLSCFARNSRQHSLAAPSTGGEVRRSFNSPSWMPQNWLREALGWTKTRSSKASPSCCQGRGWLLFTAADHPDMIIQQRLKLCFKLQLLAADILNTPLQICHLTLGLVHQPFGL